MTLNFKLFETVCLRFNTQWNTPQPTVNHHTTQSQADNTSTS